MDALAQRWHIGPSAILAEDAGLVMGILGAVGDEGQSGPAPSEDDVMRELLLNQSRPLEESLG